MSLAAQFKQFYSSHLQQYAAAAAAKLNGGSGSSGGGGAGSGNEAGRPLTAPGFFDDAEEDEDNDLRIAETSNEEQQPRGDSDALTQKNNRASNKRHLDESIFKLHMMQQQDGPSPAALSPEVVLKEAPGTSRRQAECPGNNGVPTSNSLFFGAPAKQQNCRFSETNGLDDKDDERHLIPTSSSNSSDP